MSLEEVGRRESGSDVLLPAGGSGGDVRVAKWAPVRLGEGLLREAIVALDVPVRMSERAGRRAHVGEQTFVRAYVRAMRVVDSTSVDKRAA